MPADSQGEEIGEPPTEGCKFLLPFRDGRCPLPLATVTVAAAASTAAGSCCCSYMPGWAVASWLGSLQACTQSSHATNGVFCLPMQARPAFRAGASFWLKATMMHIQHTMMRAHRGSRTHKARARDSTPPLWPALQSFNRFLRLPETLQQLDTGCGPASDEPSAAAAPSS